MKVSLLISTQYYELDPRRKFMCEAVPMGRWCRKCESDLKLPDGTCARCKDTEVVMEQARNMALGDGDTGLLIPYDAYMLLCQPKSLYVVRPCNHGHVGIYDRSIRYCLTCREMRRAPKNRYPRKTPPHC